MKFSIITPSFNQLDYLKRCVASVADQQGVDVEHIVIDGGSTDGTVEWLASQNQIQWISEPDQGMYDALNKGFSRATGDVFAWLNCDEQYLPETFQKTARLFEKKTDADLAYGDTLLVDPEGQLLTYRKNPPLRRAYVLADHLYTQSAAMFFRRRVFDSGLHFNREWKAVGDCDFIDQMLRAGFCPTQIRDRLAVCVMTGENLSRKQAGVEELRAFRQQTPFLYRAGRMGFNLCRHLEKAWRGGYWHLGSFAYDLHLDESRVRKHIEAERVSCRFRWEPHG